MCWCVRNLLFHFPSLSLSLPQVIITFWRKRKERNFSVFGLGAGAGRGRGEKTPKTRSKANRSKPHQSVRSWVAFPLYCKLLPFYLLGKQFQERRKAFPLKMIEDFQNSSSRKMKLFSPRIKSVNEKLSRSYHSWETLPSPTSFPTFDMILSHDNTSEIKKVPWETKKNLVEHVKAWISDKGKR